MTKRQSEDVNNVMSEFINTFDEFVACMHFATKGIEVAGLELAKQSLTEGHQTWIASDCEDNPKMHARVNTKEFITKSGKNSHFSNEIRKSLLCTMYSLWDEVYRHRVAKVTGYEARYIECPLMGDLRKIRHCILHHKSIVPDNGIAFEVLEWDLLPGKLEVTYELFLDFNDAVRGKRLNISGFSLSPKLAELTPEMTNKERKSFDEFFKNRENRINSVEWPGLAKFLDRIGQLPEQK
ncbi:hypothetical protein N7V09_13835 [Shewanella seohaensis]|uniref:hypothetical protein n=1 Tax=Shewanella seohaensis TaxID=755175 RepID=UPI00200DD433|nr:hypothetical protein [Shewanella seohaensis]MCL1122533.1 hypothetical protein [Shewanella seohaensis]UXM80940.1 hypothetical protein N7V09_13835 [Shewanella seohaensis]